LWYILKAERALAGPRPLPCHFQSEQCGVRGTALKEFDFYIPNDFDEAKAFLSGEPLEFRKIDV
jgi:hypothetical protein